MAPQHNAQEILESLHVASIARPKVTLWVSRSTSFTSVTLNVMFTILQRISASISQILNLSPRRAGVKKLRRIVVAEAGFIY